MKAISNENMQKSISGLEGKVLASGYTLFESLVNQIQTGFYWNSEENQIIFHVPNPDKINWEVLDIPDEITLKRHTSITFAARTGNESSLKAYQFYWEEKERTITYQFQIGSGRYTKRIE